MLDKQGECWKHVRAIQMICSDGDYDDNADDFGTTKAEIRDRMILIDIQAEPPIEEVI